MMDMFAKISGTVCVDERVCTCTCRAGGRTAEEGADGADEGDEAGLDARLGAGLVVALLLLLLRERARGQADWARAR
jgi:hypothetical protein